jgi:hypothetical protein
MKKGLVTAAFTAALIIETEKNKLDNIVFDKMLEHIGFTGELDDLSKEILEKQYGVRLNSHEGICENGCCGMYQVWFEQHGQFVFGLAIDWDASPERVRVERGIINIKSPEQYRKFLDAVFSNTSNTVH